MKRYRVFISLGIFALLLVTAAAFAPPPPAVVIAASGFGTASEHQGFELSDTHQGLVLQNAGPSNLSRVHSSSPHGIVSQPIVPLLPDVHGLGIAEILSVSTLEIGFHSLLRAPPASLLI